MNFSQATSNFWWPPQFGSFFSLFYWVKKNCRRGEGVYLLINSPLVCLKLCLINNIFAGNWRCTIFLHFNCVCRVCCTKKQRNSHVFTLFTMNRHIYLREDVLATRLRYEHPPSLYCLPRTVRFSINRWTVQQSRDTPHGSPAFQYLSPFFQIFYVGGFCCNLVNSNKSNTHIL